MRPRPGLIVYFALLYLVLGAIIFPSFSNPPHVDYWEAFFTFHQVRADPALSPWPYIINHDPWRHGTFRPLLYTMLFLEQVAFGSHFVWNHLANFFCYCLLLPLLFFLGRRLGAREFEMGGFLAVFAVLYSQCDILSLTFHIALLAGFAGFIAGFILYLRYLDGGNSYLLLPAGIVFLISMFCYETFLFWPLGVLILLRNRPRPGEGRQVIGRSVLLLAGIYLLYGCVFVLSRRTAYLSGELAQPSLSPIFRSPLLVLFNIFYTGIGVNLFPRLAIPGRYRGYSEMLGILPIRMTDRMLPVVYGGAILTLFLICFIVVRLLRDRRRRTLISSAFIGFLYLTNFSLLVIARSTTTDFSHVLRQFRYQLIPNALLALFAAIIISTFFRRSRKQKLILAFFLLAVFLANAFYTYSHIGTVTRRLAPLRELLSNIRSGIESGDISPGRRLYLSDGFATTFPRLCWNRGMGRKMWGTYQWIFSPKDLACFSRHPEDAYWTIDLERGVYVKR